MAAEILILGALMLLSNTIGANLRRQFGGMTDQIKAIPKLDASREIAPPTTTEDMVGTGTDLINRGNTTVTVSRP